MVPASSGKRSQRVRKSANFGCAVRNWIAAAKPKSRGLAAAAIVRELEACTFEGAVAALVPQVLRAISSTLIAASERKADIGRCTAVGLAGAVFGKFVFKCDDGIPPGMLAEANMVVFALRQLTLGSCKQSHVLTHSMSHGAAVAAYGKAVMAMSPPAALASALELMKPVFARAPSAILSTITRETVMRAVSACRTSPEVPTFVADPPAGIEAPEARYSSPPAAADQPLPDIDEPDFDEPEAMDCDDAPPPCGESLPESLPPLPDFDDAFPAQSRGPEAPAPEAPAPEARSRCGPSPLPDIDDAFPAQSCGPEAPEPEAPEPEAHNQCGLPALPDIDDAFPAQSCEPEAPEPKAHNQCGLPALPDIDETMNHALLDEIHRLTGEAAGALAAAESLRSQLPVH